MTLHIKVNDNRNCILLCCFFLFVFSFFSLPSLKHRRNSYTSKSTRAQRPSHGLAGNWQCFGLLSCSPVPQSVVSTLLEIVVSGATCVTEQFDLAHARFASC